MYCVSTDCTLVARSNGEIGIGINSWRRHETTIRGKGRIRELMNKPRKRFFYLVSKTLDLSITRKGGVKE